MNAESESRAAIISEMLFVVLPILIILALHGIRNEWDGLLVSPEWSFATIVLFGQAIVKFAAGICKGTKKFRWQLISLINALVIVLGLIPAVLLLVFLNVLDTAPTWAYVAQMVLLVLGGFTFLTIGTIGQMLVDQDSRTREHGKD
jgi:hypothetical protein